MNSRSVSTMLAIAIVMATAAGTAAAVGRDGDDGAAALQSAKLTLIDGIRAAEQQTGGRAYDAGIRSENGQTSIVVKTDGPRGVQTVALDAQSGQIVATHAGAEED